MNDRRTDFDLLTEEWIPVVDLDGRRRELSLLSCLECAHELREIVDPSPLVVFGLHRFLGAVLHSYLPIADEDEWAEHWDRGRFDPDFIATVRARCVGRLRLFDPERPFYQSGDIPLDGRPQEPLKTVGYLYPEESTGTNVVHFSHPGNDKHAYCPACCARGLLLVPPFSMSVGKGIKPSIAGVPPVYVLPGADSLYRTLLLNYLLPGFRPNSPCYTDPGPLWEGSGSVVAKEERSDAGFIESLTWPARRIRLYPSAGGVCSRCGRPAAFLTRRMVYVQGRSRRKDLPLWIDGWAAYALVGGKSEGQTERQPLRPAEDRDIWRDFPTLFLSRRSSAGATARAATWERPGVLEQLDMLLREKCLPSDLPLRYETFALRTDMKAKVFEWRQDLFDFPAALLPDGQATAVIERAIDLANAVDRCLGLGIRRLHPTARRDNPDRQAVRAAMRGLIGQASRNYWQNLELPFRTMIADPRLRGGAEDRRAWLLDWWLPVQYHVTRAFEDVVEAFDGDADGLRDQVAARRVFYGALKLAQQRELNLEVMDGGS